MLKGAVLPCQRPHRHGQDGVTVLLPGAFVWGAGRLGGSMYPRWAQRQHCLLSGSLSPTISHRCLKGSLLTAEAIWQKLGRQEGLKHVQLAEFVRLNYTSQEQWSVWRPGNNSNLSYQESPSQKQTVEAKSSPPYGEQMSQGSWKRRYFASTKNIQYKEVITSVSKEEAIIYHWVDNFYCFLEHKPICSNNPGLSQWRGTDSQLGAEAIIVSRLHILFNHLLFKAHFITGCITLQKGRETGRQWVTGVQLVWCTKQYGCLCCLQLWCFTF